MGSFDIRIAPSASSRDIPIGLAATTRRRIASDAMRHGRSVPMRVLRFPSESFATDTHLGVGHNGQMTADSCGSPSQPDTCSVNMGLIHLQAGDLVSAYRFFLPLAEKGDTQAITHLIDICDRGGDPTRAATWRARLVENG